MGIRCFVGIGSNLGPRRETIAAALEAMARIPGVRLRRSSPIYETDPVGGPPQARFLNGVAELDVDLDPDDLLASLLDVERDLGRRRTVRWGPRVIDLDILLYGSEVRNDDHLVLPHPRLREREFVLRPLADLDGHLAVPPGGETVMALLRRLEETPS